MPVTPSYLRAAVQLLMLTGQRVEEIVLASMSTSGTPAADHRLVSDQNLQPHAALVLSLAAELIESIKPNEYGMVLFPPPRTSQSRSAMALYTRSCGVSAIAA